jgi:hypothetical protein
MSIIVKCFGTSWNQLFETNVEDCCQKVLPCCMIMPVHTLLPRPLKFAANWIFRCWNIFYIVLMWLIPSVWSTQRWFGLRGHNFTSGQEVACHSSENIFFLGSTEACGPLDLVCWTGQEVYRIMMLLYILTIIVLFNKKLIADTFRLTLIASVSHAIQLVFFSHSTLILNTFETKCYSLPLSTCNWY